jgi:hypothetical protein
MEGVVKNIGNSLNSKKVKASVKEILKKCLEKQINIAFSDKKNPVNNQKWKSRKKRYSHPLLQKTKKMQNSTRIIIRENKKGLFVIVNFGSVTYAKYHIYGTKHMVARNFAPITKAGKASIKKECINEIQNLYLADLERSLR